MKTLILIIALLFNSAFKTTFDIAPNPIAAKGIISHKDCKIQMVSELVEVELYKDSAFVTCHFKMENKGDKTNLEIGFPVMEFQYWSFGGYTPQDKSRFTITVDDQEITKNHIKVPQELQKLYDTYMDSYSKDLGISGDVMSEFSDKVENGSFPWYVWDATFDEGEQKDIKVSYKLPSGIAPGFIETAMTDKLNEEQRAGILGAVPAGRMGTPAEIAAAVLYLSAPEAGYVTGATLHVNGGMAMI